MFSASPPTASEQDGDTVHCPGGGGGGAALPHAQWAHRPAPAGPGQAWEAAVQLNSDFWAKAGLERVGGEVWHVGRVNSIC